MVAVGNRSVVSRWADHRSSKLGAWPVVSGAAVLASGKLTTGALSGVVLWSPEGAPDLSYCCGVSCWANATPEQMSSAELARLPIVSSRVFPPVSWVPEGNALRACRVPQVVWQWKSIGRAENAAADVRAQRY